MERLNIIDDMQRFSQTVSFAGIQRVWCLEQWTLASM